MHLAGTKDDGCRLIFHNAVGYEYVLAAGVWVGNFCSRHFVRAQIEAVNHDNLIYFSPSQPANFNQVVIDCVLFGKKQGSVMCRAFCKRIRGWRHVHLAVSDQDVAVAAETAKALVLMDIRVVGVEKAAVANYKIKHGILITVRLPGIASEYVVNLPAVMFAARWLTVAVIVGLAARIGEPLEFEAFRKLDKPEIGVGIAAGRVKVEAHAFESCLEPILEMELLVSPAFTLYEVSAIHRLNAGLE